MGDILTPGNIVVAIIVVVALVVGGRRAIQGLTKGRSCCTDGAEDGGKPQREPQAELDTDPSHYAYETDLLIGGMSCEHCVARVEAALNALPGIWAQAELESHTAHVRTKEPIDRDACAAAVKDAGYYVMTL